MPPPPIVVEGEEKYEVEVILRHKGRALSRLHLVLWKGYPLTKASWEPESYLSNTSKILEEYLYWVANQEKQRRTRGGHRE